MDPCSAAWREIERVWCLALLDEGPEVIQRVTTRVLALRGHPIPTSWPPLPIDPGDPYNLKDTPARPWYIDYGPQTVVPFNTAP